MIREATLNELGKIAGFAQTKQQAISTDTCAQCGKPAVLFSDDVSVREYGLTGMCQKCQDAFYDAIKEVENGS